MRHCENYAQSGRENIDTFYYQHIVCSATTLSILINVATFTGMLYSLVISLVLYLNMEKLPLKGCYNKLALFPPVKPLRIRINDFRKMVFINM